MAAADSWYHEKESAWLYEAVAAVEPDRRHRALFLKLAAATEELAACWRRRDPGIPDHYSPNLRARSVARLLRCGLRQVLIGGGAGLAAWSIGRLLGASVS